MGCPSLIPGKTIGSVLVLYILAMSIVKHA
jgi:hypothetical protein